MTATTTTTIRPGRPDQADAAAYARFADLASGNGYRRLYGRNRLDALAAAYPARTARTLFLDADGRTAGGCGFDTARESSPAASPQFAGPRTRAVEAWRALRGIGSGATASDELYLAFLAVDPEFHRRGYGALLLHAAEAEARSRGLRRVTAIVDANNHAALAFYASQGYDRAPSGAVVRVVRRITESP